jgi:replication factor A1
MEDLELKEHVNDILTSLDDKEKVSSEEITEELNRFLEYGVPIDHAKQTLLKKYGGTPTTSPQQRTPLSEIQPDQTNLQLLCRIITITSKETDIKGEKRTIFYGIIGDETATIPFTAWNDFNLKQNDVLEITNAYSREWQGTLKLNFGDRTHITKTDANKLPEHNPEPKEYQITDFHSGLFHIETKVRLLTLKERTVTTKDTTKTVYSGVIGDKTGKAQFTSWHDHNLKEDDTLHITGGYIKTWKGIPQLTIDEKTIVEKLPKNTIKKTDIPHPFFPLYKLEERNGGYDIEIKGTIIEIRYGSGIIQRCPECNRTLQDTTCTIHGTVNPVPDFRLKLIIDDGTGAINAILNKTTSEQLLDKSFIELQKISEQTGETGLYEDINTTIFGHQIRIRGNALKDDYGLTLIAHTVSFDEIQVEQLHQELTKETETLQ